MNPVILALDVEPGRARETIKKLAPHFEIFKIGSRLFTVLGTEVIRWVHQTRRKVFLDLKFHDIPSQVAAACRNAVRLKLWGFTVHTMGGFAMMKEAVRVTQEESKRRRLKRPCIFGVTLLTSLEGSALKEIGIKSALPFQVRRLALLAQKAGLDGVVASGSEIEMIRTTCQKNFLIAVPGVRLGQNIYREDQKRIVTPQAALALGANYLIVGRPILESKDKISMTQRILEAAG